MFTFAICRRPSVCLSSEKNFGTVSTPFGTLAICDPSLKILRRSSQENPSVGGLNQRGVENVTIFDLSKAIARERCKIGGKLGSRI